MIYVNTHTHTYLPPITNLGHDPIIGSSQPDVCRHMKPATGSRVHKLYII